MVILSNRLHLTAIFPKHQSLWLSSNHSYLYFPLPQGAVWYSSPSVNTHVWLFRHLAEAKSFFRRLQTYSARLHRLFFFKLKMRGLGYRVRRITRFLYRFYFTKTNYIYLHLPAKVFIFLRKRRLFFASRQKDLLNQLVKQILRLHQPSPYNKRGFTFPRYLRRRKPGKKVL